MGRELYKASVKDADDEGDYEYIFDSLVRFINHQVGQNLRDGVKNDPVLLCLDFNFLLICLTVSSS